MHQNSENNNYDKLDFSQFMSRVKIKIIETWGKYGAIIKNLNLVKSKNFQENMKNWDSCFKNRTSENNISKKNIERIVAAYHTAINDMTNKDLYYVSNEWVPIINFITRIKFLKL